MVQNTQRPGSRLRRDLVCTPFLPLLNKRHRHLATLAAGRQEDIAKHVHLARCSSGIKVLKEKRDKNTLYAI